MAGFLDDLAERARGYTPEEVAVARACFSALLTGAPAVIPDVLSGLDIGVDAGRRVLAALEEKGVLAISAGAITVARGLSRPPTDHRLHVNEGPALYACCAVDAVAIPAALGADARVTSRCHACRAPIMISITGGQLARVAPDVVIWAADADPGRSLREYT
ncbi:MAG TPA: organomercurial lyase [Candidatus Limnocylindria bacterium]|nr:organomercurial lyase [Candidatus Limnocylindria bacterium]